MTRPFLSALAMLVLLTAAPLDRARAGALETAIEQRLGAVLGSPRSDREIEALRAVYAEREYRPLWFDAQGDAPGSDARARILSAALLAADKDGLTPGDYGAATIRSRLATSRTAKDRAALDVLMSRSYIRYAGDLSVGRLEPGEVDEELFIKRRSVAPGALLAAVAAAGDLKKHLESLAPASPRYKRLRTALADYRRIARRGGWPTVPDGETLKPGMRDPRVAVLRARLLQSGDLETPSGGEAARFDDALSAALGRWQFRHGLTPDGVLGKKTRAALNVPVEKRIARMVLNLERRRWMPLDLGRKYVFVNMADFELKVVVDKKTVHVAHVVVGKPYLRTPVFSGMMTYVVINPYWNITPSIARKEILPAIRRNVGYLAKKRITVLSGWGADAVPVDPRTVDWRALKPSAFRYKLRQEPGPGNALGRIKFMFPNRHSIYLHDTPARGLFKRTVRSFSHGCIRVQNPLKLAELVLAANPGWTRKKIDETVAKGARTVVRLAEPIPVHLTYLTAWVNKDGSVHFRDDIYGRDKRLAAALARSHIITE